MRWKVASVLRFQAAISEPKTLLSAGFLAIWLRQRRNRQRLRLLDFGALSSKSSHPDSSANNLSEPAPSGPLSPPLLNPSETSPPFFVGPLRSPWSYPPTAQLYSGVCSRGLSRTLQSKLSNVFSLDGGAAGGFFLSSPSEEHTWTTRWEKETIHRPAPVQNLSLQKKMGATEERFRWWIWFPGFYRVFVSTTGLESFSLRPESSPKDFLSVVVVYVFSSLTCPTRTKVVILSARVCFVRNHFEHKSLLLSTYVQVRLLRTLLKAF